MCERQVLIEHCQIVAVVEHCLARRERAERTTAQMIDLRTRLNTHSVARRLHSPAKVDLLHMGKEIAIETSLSLESLGTTGKRRSTCPKDLARCIILTLIAFGRTQYATTTERISQNVDKSATCACIFESLTISICQQFRSNSRQLRIGVQSLNQPIAPPLGYLNVRIEQDIIFGIDLRQRSVVALGKAVVAIQAHNLDLGKRLSNIFERRIGRAVIGHNHPILGHRRTHNARQVTLQMGATIPIQYDDLNSAHNYLLFYSVAFCAASSSAISRCFQRRCDHVHKCGARRIIASKRSA